MSYIRFINVKLAKAMRKQGATLEEIAKKFDVTRQAVHKALKGKK